MGKNPIQILFLTMTMALFQSCGEMDAVSAKSTDTGSSESSSSTDPGNTNTSGGSPSGGTTPPQNSNTQNSGLPVSDSDQSDIGSGNPTPPGPQVPLPQPQPSFLSFILERGDSFGFVMNFNGTAIMDHPATLEITGIYSPNQKELDDYFKGQLKVGSVFDVDLEQGSSTVTFSLSLNTDIPLSEKHIITASITSSSNLFPTDVGWSLEPKADDIVKISNHSPGPTVTATLSGDMYSAQTWDGRLVTTPKINHYANNIPAPVWTVERPAGSVKIMTESNISPAIWFQERDPLSGQLSISSKSQHFDGILSTTQNNNWGRLTEITTTYSSFLALTEFSAQDSMAIYGRYNYSNNNSFKLDKIPLPRKDLMKVALSGRDAISSLQNFNFFGGIDSNGNAHRWYYELTSPSTGYWRIDKFLTADSPFSTKAVDVIGGYHYLAYLMDDDTVKILASGIPNGSPSKPGTINVQKTNTKAEKLQVINKTAFYVVYHDGTARLFRIPIIGLVSNPQKLNLPCTSQSLTNTTNSYIECGDFDLQYNHLVAEPYVQNSTGITWQPVYDAANNVFKKLPVQ